MKPIAVLAFSGGARSTAAIAWLADRHRAEVVTVTIDLGQSGDMNEIRSHALAAGASPAHVIDAREEFARDIVLPSLKAGALSDTRYPMATALTRPLIAKTLVDIAKIENASQVAHGALGRDRRRLAQPIATLNPALKEIACAEEAGFTVPPGDGTPNRIDDNLWGRTIGRRDDDGSAEPDESLFKVTKRLDDAPVKAAHVAIDLLEAHGKCDRWMSGEIGDQHQRSNKRRADQQIDARHFLRHHHHHLAPESIGLMCTLPTS